MKLVRIGNVGAEKAGVLVDDDTFVDLSDVVGDYNEAFFAPGALATLGTMVAERVSAGRTEPLGNRRFGPPSLAPIKFFASGSITATMQPRPVKKYHPNRSCSPNPPIR